MPIQFQYIVRFVLLTAMIATAGCSWPGVKIGDDKYLLSPVPTRDTTKGPSTPESTREIK